MITITKITPKIGAEIKGVDFLTSLKNNVLDNIYKALIDHLVIIIRKNKNICATTLRVCSIFWRTGYTSSCLP